MPTEDVFVTPELSGFFVPDTLYTGDRSLISVQVSDPQGIPDIVSVTLDFSNTGGDVAEKAMADDGLSGDIIAGDGMYVWLMTREKLNGISGKLAVSVTAEDQNGHRSLSILDSCWISAEETPRKPVLSQAVFPDSLTNDNVTDVFFSIQVQDEQGLETIDSVWCDLYLPYAPMPFFRLYLFDDGEHGDEIQADGLYTIRANLGTEVRSSGLYTLRFQARDRSGLLSKAFVATLPVIQENEVPVIFQVTAPASLSRGDADPIQLIIIEAEVHDLQGLQDIKRVYFNSYLPNGNASRDNPILLFDDGGQSADVESGDETAGDGVYSTTIQFPSNVPLGVYRFDFFAEDISGGLSDVWQHELTVTE